MAPLPRTVLGVTIAPEDVKDGFSAEEIFSSPGSRGFTFDDVIALPGQIDFGVEEVDLSTKLTKKIELAHPFASSPMDTVTESKMAIAMALEGCVGIVHNKCSIERQVEIVSKVSGGRRKDDSHREANKYGFLWVQCSGEAL